MMTNCTFCETPVIRSSVALTVHCPSCYSKFLFSGMDHSKMIGYMIVAEYNNQFYGAVFYTSAKAFVLEKLSVNKETGKAVYMANDPLLELSYLPNITPQNFAKKLPTLLTFS